MLSYLYLTVAVLADLNPSEDLLPPSPHDSSTNPRTLTLPLPSNPPSNYSNIDASAAQFDYIPAVVGNGRPYCDGTTMGFSLDRGSCFNAWENIFFGTNQLLWGQRGTSANYNINLPYRWSSGKSLQNPAKQQYSHFMWIL